jgi:putative ABC transport system substrate-binding protein
MWGPMRRREFITLFGCAVAGSRPFPVRAQQARKIPTIGFLGAGTQSGWSNWTAAFLQRLHELGWNEAETIAIEYRWAEGRSERYAEIVAEFVRLRVDVIVSVGSAAAVAKQVTSAIPIVFTLSADPVGDGMAKSLSRPGGNVTGLSIQAIDVAGKRLELLREVVPNLRHLAILADVGNSGSTLERSKVEAAAKSLGLEVVILEMQSADDITPAFAELRNHAEALYVLSNPLANANRSHINALALTRRLPTMHGFREYVDSGGLMSYGPNTADLFRRAGDYVDKILKGAKPSDLPIEQPTRFELVINLKTAKALGLTISPTLLARADDVIE